MGREQKRLRKGEPKRGPSRDRTLPGKDRIRMRRWRKWMEKYGEQGVLYDAANLEIERSEEI